ncbi:hypothetical protein PAMP_000946 [Pampus punctatissimus]
MDSGGKVRSALFNTPVIRQEYDPVKPYGHASLFNERYLSQRIVYAQELPGVSSNLKVQLQRYCIVTFRKVQRCSPLRVYTGNFVPTLVLKECRIGSTEEKGRLKFTGALPPCVKTCEMEEEPFSPFILLNYQRLFIFRKRSRRISAFRALQTSNRLSNSHIGAHMSEFALI